LRRALPANSALVSYVEFNRRAVGKVDAASSATPWYMAFVMRAGNEPIRAIDLGDGKSIDALVSKLRASADAEAHSHGLGALRNERAYRVTGEALRKRIWDPLRAELGDAKLAMVVPDGNLNLVSLAGLPEGKGYLVESGLMIHTLSSERDLIQATATAAKKGILAVGAPQFDLAQAAATSSALRDVEIPCDAFEKAKFDPLPGTEIEVNGIRASWKRWNGAEPFAALTGSGATRERFLEEATQSRILHIATHAFVLDSGCGAGNPLLRSGLVFAGANKSRNSSIITAQQIASLDLSGVSLAILSACNTGNGELADGEGVLGLERAFRIAGARTVVMTLWPVDDTTTSGYMRTLYGEMLGQHVATADAVWMAERKMLDERRAKGQSTHPWYWAGFVASGAE
jgi:CHAT domain-containing protein